MAVAATVRQIRPMRRHTGRSTSFESAVNMGFRGTSRPAMHRSLRIKDGRGIDIKTTRLIRKTGQSLKCA